MPRCGNRKAHGKDRVYHETNDAVKACFAGGTQRADEAQSTETEVSAALLSRIGAASTEVEGDPFDRIDAHERSQDARDRGHEVVPPATTLYDGIYTIETEAGHRTFKVRTQAKDDDFAPGQQVIAYLSGPDNERDYTGFGFVDVNTLGLRLKPWKRFRSDAALLTDADVLLKDPSAALTEAHCRKCHRLLTVPASVYAGYGPECAKRLAS